MACNLQKKLAETSLTLICLSYERQPMLKRQLMYYSNKPIHLIFADGSKTPWTLGTQGAIGSLTWEYFSIRGYDSYTKRQHEAITRLKTKYVAFIDDEECLLWTGLQRAMDFLETNPEHICAGGKVCISEIQHDKLSLSPWGYLSDLCSLKDPDPMKRFNTMLSAGRTANLFYQVFRSKDLKQYDTINPAFLYRYIFGLEILFTGFLSLKGCWEMGNYPFWIRNGSSVSTPSTTLDYMSEDEMKDISQRLASAYITNKMNPLQSSAQISEESVADIICQIIDSQPVREVYKIKSNLLTGYARFFPRSIIVFLKKILRFLRTSMPRPIFNLLKNFKATLRRLGSKKSIETIEKYAAKNSDNDYMVIQDMLLIKSIWETYPNGIVEDNVITK